jgi:hypothetical protein
VIFSKSRKKRLDADDACPFPPGVDLPNKGRFTSTSGSILADPRFVTSTLLIAGIIFIFGLSLAPPPIIQLRSNPPIWNAALPQDEYETTPRLAYPSPVGPWVPRYRDVRTWEGDMILDGDQVMLVENCSYAIQGSVLLKDQATLIFKNVDIYLKPKIEVYTTDPVPYGYNMMFIDESKIQIINSTIYSEQRASAGFYNTSTCHITDSNASMVFFFGYDTTLFSLENVEASAIFLGEGAILRLDSSNVIWVVPTTQDQATDRTLKVGNLRLEASDSSIQYLTVFYMNSTIQVDEPTIGFHENWNSFRDLAPGGKGFNVTLTRTNVSVVTLMAEYSRLEINNVSDLADVYNIRGHLSAVNSSLPRLAIYGEGSVDECSIGRLTLFSGSYELSRSRFDVLFLRAGTSNVSTDQVKVNMFAGNMFNCSLSGDLAVENETVAGIRGNSKVNRSYPIQVLNGDRAAVGVDLRLYNSTSYLLWSGKTDDKGRADLEVTFYLEEFTISKPSPEFADTLRLMVSGVLGEKEVPLKFTGDTPVIVVFPPGPERPLWAQGWFVETISVVIAIIVVLLFLSERVRRRGGG